MASDCNRVKERKNKSEKGIKWRERKRRKKSWIAWIRWSVVIFTASTTFFSQLQLHELAPTPRFLPTLFRNRLFFLSCDSCRCHFAHTIYFSSIFYVIFVLCMHSTDLRFLSNLRWNVEHFFSSFLLFYFVCSFVRFHLIPFFPSIYLFITDSNARQREDKTCGDTNGETKSRRYRNKGSEKGKCIHI